MPAGSYRIGTDLGTGLISFTGEPGEDKTFLMGTPDDDGDGKSQLVYTHSGDVYAPEEPRSDAFNWVFQTRMPVPPMESHNALPQVEVALSR
jgi:hypothetical protein